MTVFTVFLTKERKSACEPKAFEYSSNTIIASQCLCDPLPQGQGIDMDCLQANLCQKLPLNRAGG